MANRSYHRWTDEDIAFLRTDGPSYTTKELALRFGVAEDSVVSICSKHGIKRPFRVTHEVRIGLTADRKSTIVKRYLSGESLSILRRTYHLDSSTLKRILSEHAVTVRTTAESVTLSIRRAAQENRSMRNRIEVSEGGAIIWVRCKEKLLAALCDVDIVQRLYDFGATWTAIWTPEAQTYYVSASVPWDMQSEWGNAVSLHRFILVNPAGVVDHIDHNGLNNQRSNLRVVDSAINGAYHIRANRSNKSSRFCGVSRHKSSGRWIARAQFRQRSYFLGTFDSEEQAAWAVYTWKRDRDIIPVTMTPEKYGLFTPDSATH